MSLRNCQKLILYMTRDKSFYRNKVWRNTEMAKAVKLADIAQKAGVSTVTVSKALSGQKGVSEEMREIIKKLADEMGYIRPSKEKAGGGEKL